MVRLPAAKIKRGKAQVGEVIATTRFASLPADERQKLKAAHEKAMQDPAVRAAHDKMRQAHREFRNAMHAGMLQADPSIQPILDEMPKGGKGDRDED